MPVMARPSTLTPEITSQLCAARRVGATLKAASGAVGVPYRTLMDWLRLGRAEGADGPYADLARGLDAATTAPAAPPRGTGRAHTRPDHADGRDGPVMALCGHTARRADLRRGLCRTCYRKLWEHDCLPPRGSRWDGYDALAEWARALPAETRARILAALAEAS